MLGIVLPADRWCVADQAAINAIASLMFLVANDVWVRKNIEWLWLSNHVHSNGTWHKTIPNGSILLQRTVTSMHEHHAGIGDAATISTSACCLGNGHSRCEGSRYVLAPHLADGFCTAIQPAAVSIVDRAAPLQCQQPVRFGLLSRVTWHPSQHVTQVRHNDMRLL